MATLGNLIVKITADTGGLKQGTEQTKSFLGGLGKIAAVAGAATLAIGATVGVIRGIASAVGEWTDAARVQIAAEKQLEQVIKSTGGAAGVTAEEAKKLASALQGVTNFGDEVTIKGEALLLTFTNIGKEVFPRATETMLDMSAALGQDLKTSAIQLGKALNDPLKGMTALQRVGVSFTAEQKKMVAEMMKTNDVAGAQGIILDELAREFGGQARALADPIIQLNNAWGDLKETLGMAVLPLLNSLAQAGIPPLIEAIGALGNILTPLGTQLGTILGPFLGALATALAEVFTAFSELNSAFKAAAAALGYTGEGVSLLRLLLQPLIGIMQGLTIVFQISSTTISAFAMVFQAVALIVEGARQGWEGFSFAARTVTSDLQAAKATWDTLVRGFQIAWDWVKRLTAEWLNFSSALSRPISIPDWLKPGSPPPLANGLRDIASAIKDLPPLDQAFRMPGGSGVRAGSGATNNYYVDGVRATANGSTSPVDDAIQMTVGLLRQQLMAGG